MTQKINPSEKVGKNLKNLIKHSKFRTQERFADEIHVDPVTVRRWLKSGIRDINLIIEIAEMFDVDFQELLK